MTKKLPFSALEVALDLYPSLDMGEDRNAYCSVFTSSLMEEESPVPIKYNIGELDNESVRMKVKAAAEHFNRVAFFHLAYWRVENWDESRESEEIVFLCTSDFSWIWNTGQTMKMGFCLYDIDAFSNGMIDTFSDEFSNRFTATFWEIIANLLVTSYHEFSADIQMMMKSAKSIDVSFQWVPTDKNFCIETGIKSYAFIKENVDKYVSPVHKNVKDLLESQESSTPYSYTNVIDRLEKYYSKFHKLPVFDTLQNSIEENYFCARIGNFHPSYYGENCGINVKYADSYDHSDDNVPWFLRFTILISCDRGIATDIIIRKEEGFYQFDSEEANQPVEEEIEVWCPAIRLHDDNLPIQKLKAAVYDESLFSFFEHEIGLIDIKFSSFLDKVEIKAVPSLNVIQEKNLLDSFMNELFSFYNFEMKDDF